MLVLVPNTNRVSVKLNFKSFLVHTGNFEYKYCAWAALCYMRQLSFTNVLMTMIMNLGRFSVWPPSLTYLHLSVLSCCSIPPPTVTHHIPPTSPRVQGWWLHCVTCSHTVPSPHHAASLSQQQFSSNNHTLTPQKKRPFAPFANQLRAIWA